MNKNTQNMFVKFIGSFFLEPNELLEPNEAAFFIANQV